MTHKMVARDGRGRFATFGPLSHQEAVTLFRAQYGVFPWRVTEYEVIDDCLFDGATIRTTYYQGGVLVADTDNATR